MSDQDSMSDHDQTHPVFRNEDTVLRRAWIDRALAGVRRHLAGADPGLAGEDAGSPGEEDPREAAAPAPDRPRGPPRLYLVPNGKAR